MALKKLESTNAFFVTDLAGAPASGVVRVGRKILQSSAKDMARTATYSFAAFEIQRGGASAGINAEGDDVDAAVAAFVEEVGPVVASGDLHLDPAKGVPDGSMAALADAAERHDDAGSIDATVAGTIAAAAWSLGGSLDGKKVAIEGKGAIPSAIATAAGAAGAEIVEVDGVDKKPWLVWGAAADAIFAGSKMGTLTHQGTEYVKASSIVPWGPTPVTTKAFAQLKGAGVSVLPDFITAAGGLLAGYLPDGGATIADQVTAKLESLAGHDDGVLLAACYDAETYLSSWVDELPFGRPLAA